MKTLIVYATKYGFTEKTSRKLAESLNGDVRLINLKNDNINNIDFDEFDTVAIGGSIYAGKIQGEVKDFCNKNMEQLIEKKIGLFICCSNLENLESQLENAFDETLRNHALAISHFGCTFDFDKMNFFMKMMVKKLAKINESKTEMLEENIKRFAEKLMVEKTA